MKKYAYTIFIVIAVLVAYFFPQYFIEVGGVKLTTLVLPMLQVIMFGMGTTMTAEDFMGVIRNPKGVFVGLFCQFSIMPFVGFFITLLFNFPPEIAAGIILIGSSPSGLASNVMAYIAKANVPLSITITSCATLLAPFLTPFFMKTLGGGYIDINFWKMMWDITKIVILPIAIGYIINRYYLANRKMPIYIGFLVMLMIIVLINGQKLIDTISNLFSMDSLSLRSFVFRLLIQIAVIILIHFGIKNFSVQLKKYLPQILPLISMAGIAYVIMTVTAAGHDALVTVGALLLLAVLIHNLAGFLFGFYLAKLFKLPEQDCRTVAIEVGLQNGGLASGLAIQMGKAATVGLAAALFGPLMNITGSLLASYWSKKPVINPDPSLTPDRPL